MPNHVLISTSSHDNREEIQQENILNRQFLFTVKENINPLEEVRNLYIKWQDKLQLLGGTLKQNKLIAGDNIEINPLEINPKHDCEEEIRLKDDIIINTCTLTPDKDITPWKGMIKIGEIDNVNFFPIMKKTDLKEKVFNTKGSVYALLGGELLIEITDTEGQIRYMHYAISLTSTGSWSIKGAGHVPTQLRVGEMTYLPNETQHYGVVLPKEYSVYENTSTPIYDKTDLSAYLGVLLGEDEDELYLYNTLIRHIPLTKEIPVRDYGLTEGDGYTRDIWTAPIRDMDTTMLRWVKNNPKMSEKDAIAPWLDWTKNNYKLGIIFDTKNVTFRPWKIYNISEVILLKKTGIAAGAEWMQPYATYSLVREELSYTLEDWGADSMATYNEHWYVLSAPLFLQLCGFTPRGDWRTYNTYGLVFGLRIYTLGNITKIIRVGILNSVTRVPIKIIEITDTDIEFSWESDLASINSEKYIEMPNDSIERFCKFTDRELGPDKKGLKIRGISTQLLNQNNEVVEDSLDFVKFDQNFVDNNFIFVSNLSNNKNPVFTTEENNTPRLTYSGQEELTNDECTSLIGVLNTQYKNLLGYDSEEKKVVKTFEIKHANFWFNGWKNISEDLQSPPPVISKDWKFSVLPDISMDEENYIETKYYPSIDEYEDKENGIPSLPLLEKSYNTYKVVILKDILTLKDLENICKYLQQEFRPISLDLSNCTVADDAKHWENIFTGCSSLHEFILPKGVEKINLEFKWCMNLRKLDLLPSQDTLTEIGAIHWEQNSGFLVSTKVNQLIIPKSVSLLRNYFLHSYSMKALIFLHDETIGFIEDQSNNPVASDRIGTLSCAEWAWTIQDNIGLKYNLPEDFHLFFSQKFWEQGTSRGAKWGQPNKNGSGWDWFPTIAETTRWNKNVIDSIVIYPQDGSLEEWQEFHDKYGWDENLINKIRSYFGHTDWLAIND